MSKSKLRRVAVFMVRLSAEHGRNSKDLHNKRNHPRLRERLRRDQQGGKEMRGFIRVAEICLQGGRDVSFECPGIAKDGFRSLLHVGLTKESSGSGQAISGCADGELAEKPWRVVTSKARLAKNLAELKFTHSHHSPREVSFTRQAGLYTRPMCRLVLESLSPS